MNSARENPAPSTERISDVAALAQAFSASVGVNRLPAPEPSVFTGDPLQYNDWNISFRTLVEERNIPQADKIHYLKRYLGGAAKEAVSGYFLLQSEFAYEEARALLEERYGNQFIVTDAFRNKLDAWPKIPPRDGKSLRRFSDFLRQCKVAITQIPELEILNDSRENKKLLQKLPDWVVNRWSRIVSMSRKEKGKFPSFAQFADFISEEASFACDPVTSFESLKGMTQKDGNDQDKSTPSDKKGRGPAARTLVSEVQDKETCFLCKKSNHALTECRIFGAKPVEEKQDFIRKNGLCFGCLQQGHMSKGCPQKGTCKICLKQHPTSLHREPRTSSDPKENREKVEKLRKTENHDRPESNKGNENEAFCRRVY